MKESSFWRLVKERLPGVTQRIENTAGNGIPDVLWTDSGYEIWIELKIMTGNRITVRPSQRQWLEGRNRTGTLKNVFYLARCKDDIYVWPGYWVLDAARREPTRETLAPLQGTKFPGKRFEWKKIEEFMKNHLTEMEK